GLFDRDFIWAGIDHEQEVTRLHALLIPHVQFDDMAVDLRRDADEVGSHRGVVGLGVDLPLPDGEETDHDGASDDDHAYQSSDPLKNRNIFSLIHLTHDLTPERRTTTSPASPGPPARHRPAPAAPGTGPGPSK